MRRHSLKFYSVVVGGLAVLGLGVTAALMLSSDGSAEHRNPSFRYGEMIMLDKLYGTMSGDVDAACRAAMEHPADPPTGFDRSEAIAGCKYQEYQLDN